MTLFGGYFARHFVFFLQMFVTVTQKMWSQMFVIIKNNILRVLNNIILPLDRTIFLAIICRESCLAKYFLSYFILVYLHTLLE